MNPTLSDRTRLARQLDALSDQLTLLHDVTALIDYADDAADRRMPRDLVAALDSLNMARADLAAAIADQAAGLDRAISRHPAGRALAAVPVEDEHGKAKGSER